MIDSRFYDLSGPFSLSEIGQNLDIEPLLTEKMGDQIIQSPAELSVSKPGQISFLADKRHIATLEGAKATACFVTERLASLVSDKDIIPLITKTPRAHFARAVSKMVVRKTLQSDGIDSKIDSQAYVHPTTVLADGVQIAKGAWIGPYCILGPGVSIGAGTVLEGHVSVQCAQIGRDCVIKNSAQIGGDGFGVDKDENGVVDLPHVGRAILGDRVRIGSQSCVDRGFLGDTIIESDVKIDNMVQVAHNCFIGEGSRLAGHVGISGSCHVGKNVMMGGAVGLADHLTVGDGAQIAASAGVMNNIPAGEIWAGTPALPIREQARIQLAMRKLIAKKK